MDSQSNNDRAETNLAVTRTATRRKLVPRFSLAAVLIALTAASVGLWYWYRVPFEVVSSSGAGPFRTSEWYRRGWGGERILHGPRRIFVEGKLLRLETYSEGVPHGDWVWKTESGEVYLSCTYDRGRLVSIAPHADCDQRLAELLADGAIDNPKIRDALLLPSRMSYQETPLNDAIHLLRNQYSVPVMLDFRETEEGANKLEDRLPVSYSTPITHAFRDEPLIVILGRILQPYGLVCDYRYGILWITERERAGQEPTGVAKIVPPPGSALAAEWERPVPVDFIEYPAQDAFAIVSQSCGGRVRFDARSLSESVRPRRGELTITLSLKNLPLKHVVGVMLSRIECQARLEGETIVIEPQQP